MLLNIFLIKAAHAKIPTCPIIIMHNLTIHLLKSILEETLFQSLEALICLSKSSYHRNKSTVVSNTGIIFFSLEEVINSFLDLDLLA